MSVIAHRKYTAIASPMSAFVGSLRNAIMSGAKLLMHIFEVFAEARQHKAAIEAELYLNRYRHSSKNDDDLPIAR